jgi:uncharacterized protein
VPSNKSKVGKGWRGDAKAHARVGRLGGLATAKNHDVIFYARIGKLGGRVSGGNFAKDPMRAREAGRKGGKARSKRVS